MIDGVIEAIGQKADSVFDFIQYKPYENEETSEKTLAYLLKDAENLYIAFRYYLENRSP